MKNLTISIAIIGFMAMLYAARPFTTDDAGTVEAAGYELEIGYDFWEDEGTFGLGFKHGLTEKMDIGVGFGYCLVPEETRDFSNADFCLKYALIPDMFSASFTTSFGDFPFCLNGILTRFFGQTEIDANLGYSVGDSTITYALALIYNMMKFGAGVEALGDKEGLQEWQLGGRYRILNNLAVDGGLASDFKLEAKTATLGLHYEF